MLTGTFTQWHLIPLTFNVSSIILHVKRILKWMMLFDTYHFKTKRAFYHGSTIFPISIAEVVVTFDKGESFFLAISKPKEPFTMSNTRPAR